MLTSLVKGLLLCCEAGDFPRNVTLQSDGSINSQLSLSMIHNVTILIILIGGILGNIMILVVLSRPIFRGISYLYLGGIALAHLGVLVAWIPIYFRLRNQMGNAYPSVFYSAHLELVALNTCSIASTLIMTCLVIDRYIFIFFPTRIRAGKARKNVRSFILYSFILGFSASAPQTGMRMVYEEATSFTLRENISVTGSSLWFVYIWSMVILTRICPTAILVILNSLIIKRFLELNARKKQFQSVNEQFRSQKDNANLQNRNSRYREEQQLTVLTTCMISCFIVTMIPSLVAVALCHYHADHNYSPYLDLLLIVTELSNFAIYIFLYALCSEQFRKEIFKLLRSKCLEPTDPGPEQEAGEFEDFSRHGTTIRLTPEQTKLNSPGSPRNEIT